MPAVSPKSQSPILPCPWLPRTNRSICLVGDGPAQLAGRVAETKNAADGGPAGSQRAGQLLEVGLVALPLQVARVAAVKLAADPFDHVNQDQLGAMMPRQRGRVLQCEASLGL